MRGYGGEADRFLLGNPAVQPIADLTHANGFHDRKGGIRLQLPQRPHLFDRTILKHRGEPACNPVAQNIAVRRENVAFNPPAIEQCRLGLVVETR
jgi:hypothetical protein